MWLCKARKGWRNTQHLLQPAVSFRSPFRILGRSINDPKVGWAPDQHPGCVPAGPALWSTVCPHVSQIVEKYKNPQILSLVPRSRVALNPNSTFRIFTFFWMNLFVLAFYLQIVKSASTSFADRCRSLSVLLWCILHGDQDNPGKLRIENESGSFIHF